MRREAVAQSESKVKASLTISVAGSSSKFEQNIGSILCHQDKGFLLTIPALRLIDNSKTQSQMFLAVLTINQKQFPPEGFASLTHYSTTSDTNMFQQKNDKAGSLQAISYTSKGQSPCSYNFHRESTKAAWAADFDCPQVVPDKNSKSQGIQPAQIKGSFICDELPSKDFKNNQ